MVPYRLLHVFPTFGPGGAELLMASVMNTLGAEFEHVIVPLNGRSDAADQVRTPARFVAAPPGSSSPSYGLQLRRVARREQPDLLLTYNWGAIDAVIGTCLFPFCPVIHNEHGFGPDEATRLKRRRVLARRLVLNRIFGTIVVSERLREIALAQYRIAPSKVRFIQNGIDTEQFRPGRNPAWRKAHGIPEDALVFGYMGGLRPEKRLDFMIEAFAKADLPRAMLVLVGEGGCRPQLEKLAAGPGLARRVVLAGHTRFPEQAFPAFDVFLMASSTEQSPTSIMQAMACGLPVIATDVGDCARLVGKGSQSIVAAGDLEGYVRALRRAAVAEWRAEAGARDHVRAAAEFSKDRMAREYDEVWRAAIAAFRQ
jgi:glycosyltransferase involved in cell wall biosynthesis